MATATKQFSFNTDLESWVFNAGGGSSLAAGTGADTVVDILRSPDGGAKWESIFGAGAELTILAGEVRATASVFAIATLQRDDLVQYSIASVGTDAAGLEACLKGRVVTN